MWLDGLRTGAMQAFDALYIALVPVLHKFAQRFVSADVAEDIVQDVMVDLWDRRKTVVVRGSLRGYLFGAVRRRIADRQRHDGVVQRHLALTIATDPTHGTQTPTPDQTAEANELATAVDSALATLPERTRLILTMRWIDGLSYSEIAEALDISTEAAKKQGRRMEIVVRTLLARFSPDPP
jgi:RNA polymerase sigma-70 factor (ECF subfamily)